ncbi:4133_t:CDS:2 [Acaulospora colombiana]|uniref:4133_t:CDS:1 n=1 Tax=Acaulospora colombiana TaxID=27376 RepID=A0ACA9KYG6_9GLOM|nr:4133_t:CDS:2 [Acaulospora colombiana]
MPRAKAQPKSITKIRGQSCSRVQKLRLSNNFNGENMKSDNNLNTYLSNIIAPTKLSSQHVSDCDSPTTKDRDDS